MKLFYSENGFLSLFGRLIFRLRYSAFLLGTLVSFAALQAQNNAVMPFTFTTLAGNAIVGSLDGTGVAARFTDPSSMAVDTTGNIYVTDSRRVRKITPAGVVTTLAGNSGTSYYGPPIDGIGTAAQFGNLSGIAVDANGNVYVSDLGYQTIRKITPAGVVTTFAGSPGNFPSAPIDGVGTAARFVLPSDVALDGLGNVYVADDNLIRKITPEGVVTTIAVLASQANHLTVDQEGNVYAVIAYAIVKVTSDGVVRTLVDFPSVQEIADGIGSVDRFSAPGKIAGDQAGNLFVTDADNSIRKITSVGVVTTPIHIPTGETGDGLKGFSAIAVDAENNFYVADNTTYAGCHVIRKITPLGVVTNLAGATTGSADGTASVAQFKSPDGLAVDGVGNVYVADSSNCSIRKISSSGVVTTFAGAPGVVGSIDGTGMAAQFNHPKSVAIDSDGNLYVTDSGNCTIRKITSTGVVTTFAGTAGVAASADGMGMAAHFNAPVGIAVDRSGNVYVADTGNRQIRKISPAGMVMTLAGGPVVVSHSIPYTSRDGTGSAASFAELSGLTVDGAGNLYVADDDTIREITAAGVVTTVAGRAYPYSAGYADGVGSAAGFNGISNLAVDGDGNVYATDTGDSVIRKMTPAGLVTTVAGMRRAIDSIDGAGSAVSFYAPKGLAIDSAGNLYVSDNDTIRKGVRTTTKSSVDFNGDGKSDILFSNTVTGDRAMWLMDGMAVATNAFVGTVPPDWVISGTGDFDGDGKRDIFWTNTATGDRAIWLMNGRVVRGGDYMGTVPVKWTVSGTGDFDGDGKTDILWTNTTTGERTVWLMNGLTIRDGASLGVFPVSWTISGVGDFNADGKADVLLSNTVTGDRAMWLMNGAAVGTNAFVGTVPVAWTISATGDFNGDGKADIFWTNTVTGDRVVWLMNGSTNIDGGYLGAVPLEWVVSGTRDFDGDGRADLIWTNTLSGERAIWLMNGAVIGNGSSLGVVPLSWAIF